MYGNVLLPKLLLLLGVILGTAHPVLAIRIESGKNPIIDKPVYDDLYIAGGEILINAPVYGDLIIAGGTVTINDTVANDILAAGGTVSFNGYVGDDIRCAGGNLKILKNVAGDVVASGGNIVIRKGAVVGNLVSAGGEITIDGNVAGLVKAASGNLVLNGNVMKELNCRGGDITINGIVQGRAVVAANDRIIIGDAAEFHNGVRYWAGRQYVDFKHSVKSGRAVFDTSLRTGYDRWYLLGFASVLGLLWYLGTVLLMIMIIQYLFGSTMKKAGQTAYNQTLKSLGYGFLFWIGVPVAAALACLTIIGLPVGIILLFSYVLLALFAATITSVVVANWFNNRSDMNWRYWPMVFITLGIFIIVKVLSFIPFLGWFIFAMLACIAFGSILLNVNWRRKQTALA